MSSMFAQSSPLHSTFRMSIKYFAHLQSGNPSARNVARSGGWRARSPAGFSPIDLRGGFQPAATASLSRRRPMSAPLPVELARARAATMSFLARSTSGALDFPSSACTALREMSVHLATHIGNLPRYNKLQQHQY